MLLGIGKCRMISNEDLPRRAGLQIQHDQAAPVSGVGQIGKIVHYIDTYVIERILLGDNAIEVVLPDDPVRRQVEFDQLRRQAFLVNLGQR